MTFGSMLGDPGSFSASRLHFHAKQKSEMRDIFVKLSAEDYIYHLHGDFQRSHRHVLEIRARKLKA